MPPGSGESARARHVETPQEVAAAKAQERLFVEHFLPVVRAHAYRRFRHLQYHEKQEVVQEAIAVAWRLFIRVVGTGRDLPGQVVRVAFLAVRCVRQWQYLVGAVSRSDALSRRVAVCGLARVLTGGVPPESSARVERPDLDAERNEYLARLTAADRQIVEFLSHNSVAETKAQFGLRQKDLEALYERLSEV
jgi:hypothetical protein